LKTGEKKMKKGLMIKLIAICLIMTTISFGGTDFDLIKTEKEYGTILEYATNKLPDAKVFEVYGIKFYGYTKEDFKIIKARSTLFRYYFMLPTYEFSQYMTMAEEWNALGDHVRIQEELFKKQSRKDRLKFSFIGAGAGSTLTVIAIVLIKSLIN
jgi:hypothetical protein